MIAKRSRRDIDGMRLAGGILVEAMAEAKRMLDPGIATLRIDEEVEKFVLSKGGELLFKGYRGFPKSTCISINEEVVHGIPGRRRVEAGDIVSIDIGVKYQGWCADAARTFAVGDVSEEKTRLVETARGALQAAISTLRPSMKLVEIGKAVQDFAESRGFSVVRSYVGHGIGRKMHEEPQVANFVDGSAKQATTSLPAGCVLAIEPMVNAGTYEVDTLANGWTVVTADRRPSAHWEDTVAITEDGPVIITA